MTVATTKSKNDIMVEWSPTFRADDAPTVRARDQAAIKTALETAVRTRAIPVPLKRVRIYGYVRRGQTRVHKDQRFTAQGSSHEVGVFTDPLVLVICHSANKGWYVVPLTVKP